jgi:uncharacterized protein YjbJ (UPF0337 family)
MNKDKIKGKANELVGNTRERAGRKVGSDSMEAEGRRQSARGKTQSTVGKVKDKVDDVKDKIKGTVKG